MRPRVKAETCVSDPEFARCHRRTGDTGLDLAEGAALATAGLAGAGTTASAGCGITLELHNRSSAAITVDWHDSDVRTGGVGWWKRLGSGTTSVAAGDTVRQNFTADLGCGLERLYRLDVNQGNSSWFVHHGYTLDVSPHIDLD